MAKDRLPELLQRSTHSAASSKGSLQALDSTTHVGMAEQHGAPVDAILNPYSEIRVNISQIAANLDTMNRMVQTVNIRAFNENEMDDLRNQNLKLGNQLINKFNEFKAKLPPENDYSLEARMQRTLFYGLHKNYSNIWSRNEEFLQLYERKLKKNLLMHSKIINCNATEEEIEELIANKTTNLFVGNILEETEKERKTLRDLMDRFNELKKLEKSIEDVHALFMRIQTLVLEQSEVIDRISVDLPKSVSYVQKGARELESADKLHKKAVKKKFILITIAVAVVIILILIAVYL